MQNANSAMMGNVRAIEKPNQNPAIADILKRPTRATF
jgi:hypothetical protein